MIVKIALYDINGEIRRTLMMDDTHSSYVLEGDEIGYISIDDSIGNAFDYTVDLVNQALIKKPELPRRRF